MYYICDSTGTRETGPCFCNHFCGTKKRCCRRTSFSEVCLPEIASFQTQLRRSIHLPPVGKMIAIRSVAAYYGFAYPKDMVLFAKEKLATATNKELLIDYI